MSGVNELESGIFPSLKRRGGCAIQKISRRILGSRRRGGRFGELFRPKDFAERTTPSAALLWLRDFLLMPHPPLLFKEGKTPDSNLFTASQQTAQCLTSPREWADFGL